MRHLPLHRGHARNRHVRRLLLDRVAHRRDARTPAYETRKRFTIRGSAAALIPESPEDPQQSFLSDHRTAVEFVGRCKRDLTRRGGIQYFIVGKELARFRA